MGDMMEVAAGGAFVVAGAAAGEAWPEGTTRGFSCSSRAELASALMPASSDRARIWAAEALCEGAVMKASPVVPVVGGNGCGMRPAAVERAATPEAAAAPDISDGVVAGGAGGVAGAMARRTGSDAVDSLPAEVGREGVEARRWVVSARRGVSVTEGMSVRDESGGERLRMAESGEIEVREDMGRERGGEVIARKRGDRIRLQNDTAQKK